MGPGNKEICLTIDGDGNGWEGISWCLSGGRRYFGKVLGLKKIVVVIAIVVVVRWVVD